MKLKIQLQHPNAKAPTYATEGAAAFDLYAATVNGAASIGDVVYPGHPVICDTGVACEVPDGYMLQVRSRSGLAFKHGVEAFHGTIDSDYRGTVQVLLTCAYLDDDEPPVKINPGDRIAQACLVPVPQVVFEVVCVLVDSPPQPVPAPVQEQPPTPASKPVLLQCLGCERVGTQEQLSASTDCDCWLHTQPAPVQEPEKLNPLTQLQVAYVMGLRDAQPRKAVKLSYQETMELVPIHLQHFTDGVLLQFIGAIEAAVLKANGWTE